MQVEPVAVPAAAAPFPLYPDIIERLRDADAHPDPTVAHALMLLAGYSYADAATEAMMASRVGFRGECIRYSQVIDVMYVFSTAYVMRSECGRVAIVVYRGTELVNVGGWLGDLDVGDERLDDGTRVHAGFHRNMRATRLAVVDALLEMDSLETLYLAGHSLGGAMAMLFALTLAGGPLASRLKAVYTFGQPLACEPSPQIETLLRQTFPLHRYVLARDPIPALPVAAWGRLSHCGHEHRFADGAWRTVDEATAQLKGVWHAAWPLFARFGSEKRRQRARLTLAEHGPHRYIEALRPAGQLTELGD